MRYIKGKREREKEKIKKIKLKKKSEKNENILFGVSSRRIKREFHAPEKMPVKISEIKNIHSLLSENETKQIPSKTVLSKYSYFFSIYPSKG